MTKLTLAQLRVLRNIAKNHGPSMTVWALGRNTCEALRKRGLIETASDQPIRRFDGAPFVRITALGRAALEETRHAD